MDVETAIDDLENRTIAGIAGDIGRLIYLASTRDYNTGHYYHAGLASSFTEEVASKALAACHQEAFRRLVFNSLENLVEQMEAFVSSARVPAIEIVEAWKKLEPYRVTIPMDSDPVAAGLFFANIKTALAILQARLAANLLS